MQEYIMFNGIKIKQPDEDGYNAVLATTSTEDSDRDMGLTMHNTPIGTVAGYDLKWTNIAAADASAILKQVIDKESFTVHYFDIVSGTWKDGEFYATTFNAPSGCLKIGEECWDELAFNIRGIKKI